MTTKDEVLARGQAIGRLGHAAANFPARAPLLARLAELPEEAWQYVVVAAAADDGGIWFDGIGGFSEASQAAIAEVRTTAKAILGL